MKSFEVYKNIRKGAMIWGLPIALFALMMIAVITSLLVIIFSFSFVVVIGVFLFNAFLYLMLTKFSRNPQIFKFSGVFPQIISNKQSSLLDYEKD